MSTTLSQCSSFTLESQDFQNTAEIPTVHTCEGKDLSPSLLWENAPADTQSFVIICYDPDAPDPAAPKMTYYHWLMYNIPAETTSLPQGVGNVPSRAEDGVALPAGILIGSNSHNRQEYHGPCPPIGRHRYFFEIYAIDVETLKDEKGIELKAGADKDTIQQAMGGSEPGQGHILDKAVLVGTYQKKT